MALFRKHHIFASTFLLMAVVFGWQASALGISDGIMTILSWVFALLSMVVGFLLTFLMKILVNVAQFNQFIYVEPVIYGWVVVRDICNMFFIVVLLIIAFATILQLNGYDYKKDVPKLVMAAILINFSKMFAGLMIDVSQVIMLTFVNAFAANGANNFAFAFQVFKYNSFAEAAKKGFTGSDFSFKLLVGSVAGFFAACIATIIVVVMTIALVMRIVMLWIYVILSPLPYLLSTFQKGKSYADKWWGEFTKELIGGPVLAFFLWLALTVAKMPVETFTAGEGNFELKTLVPGADTASLTMSGGTDLFTNGPFQKYLIVIGLMVGGLKIAGEAGGTVGTWAKKGSGWVNSGMKTGFGATIAGDFLNRKFSNSKTAEKWGIKGFDFNMMRQVGRIKSGFERTKKKELLNMQVSAAGNLQRGGVRGAITGFTATDWVENYVKGWFNKDGFGKMRNSGEQNIKTRLEEYNRLKNEQKQVTTNRKWNEDFGKAQVKLQEAKDKDINGSNQRNIEKYQGILNTLAEAKRNNLVYRTDEEAKAKKDELSTQANDIATYVSKYKISTIYGDAEQAAAIAEAKKNVTSDNEDELIADFGTAMATNNLALAAAIAQKLVPVGGFNGLLGTYGYSAKAGFTKEEKAKLLDTTGKTAEQIKKDKDYYEKQKGANDFVRDYFGDKLGMSEQNYLRLQSNLSGAAESNSHAYLAKTVGANLGGLEQTSSAERESVIVGEFRKGENEGSARKMNRLFYGDDSSGKFEFSPSGLMKFINGFAIIAKEVKQKRFNPSAAKAFAEPQAWEIIEKVIERGIKEGIINEDDENIGPNGEKFKGYFKVYTDVLKKESVDKITDLANELTD